MKEDKLSLNLDLAEVCASVSSTVQQVQVQDPERESYHPNNYSLQVGLSLIFIMVPV